MDEVELAKRLIRYDTTSPAGRDVFTFLEEFLTRQGVDTQIHTVDDFTNLTATTGSGGDTRICFNGHLDVVEANGGWTVTDPFDPVVEEGRLYGRGAADMKAGMAAQVMAFLDLHQDPSFDGELTLMAVGDEEIGGFKGTRSLVREVEPFDYALIGEPTNMDVQVGARGIFWANVYLKGRSGHAARPHAVDNVVEAELPRVLNALQGMEMDYENDDLLPEPTAPVTTVETAGPHNSIPGEVRIGLDIRHLPSQTMERVETDIRRALDPLDVAYELEVTDYGQGFKLQDDGFKHMVTEVVEEVSGRTPMAITDGGSSDGRFFAEVGTPYVELGVDKSLAHQPDECCKVENIRRLRKAYAEIARRLA